jgi:hypothetical protein
MRDDSGWNTADPMPIRAAAVSTIGKVVALARSSRPHKVDAMPRTSE